MNDASHAGRPRRLQFSLRLLLLAVTVFAIGFPIWYRWPYEEETTHLGGQTRADPLAPFDDFDSFGSPRTGGSTARRVTTWQRQWGGGRLKHGPERLLDGEYVRSTMYIRGKKHGPYTERNSNGDVVVSGQFVDDMKEGKWIYKDVARKRTVTWHRDLLDGPLEIETLGQPTLRFKFTAGRLTHLNGQPARNRLFDLLEAGKIDARTAAELRKTTFLDPVETQLADLITMIGDMHVVNIVLDPFHVPDLKLPITERIGGIELCTALALLTAPRDLGCDYRYGCIWVTSAEDAEDWHDPTGVAEIQPLKRSDIARAWNEPTQADPVNQPLAEVLAQAAQPLAIAIDTSRIAPSFENAEDFRVTARVGGLPFRHALGILLYFTRCRCQLDGDKLVILPPDEMEKP